MTRCRDLALFPCLLTSCWYLLIKNIQLGIPMTMIRGGISAGGNVANYNLEDIDFETPGFGAWNLI